MTSVTMAREGDAAHEREERPGEVVDDKVRDRELVRSALSGQRSALEELARRLGCVPRILLAKGHRLGLTLSREELADLVQDVVARVLAKLPVYRGQARLETWIYPFCVLELLNHVRRKREVPSSLAEAEAPATCHEEESWDEGDFERLYRSLERLPAAQADSVRLRWFNGASFEEIGGMLAVPVNTAKTLYYRGMERLRLWMGPSLRRER